MIFPRRGTLTRRLVWWNAFTVAVILLILGLITRYSVRAFLTAAIERDLERQARPSNPPPRPPDPSGSSEQERRPPPPPPNRESNPYRALRIDRNGVPQSTEGRHPWDPEAIGPALLGERTARIVTFNDAELYVLTIPSTSSSGGAIQIAHSLTDFNRTLDSIDLVLLILAPLALLGAFAGSLLVTHNVLQRVHAITESVQRMGSHRGDSIQLARRLKADGDDEFAHLSRTFNLLLDRVEQAFERQNQALEQQRRFTSDASHELKTPLTVIRGSASLALSANYDAEAQRAFLADIHKASVHMSALVQDLLLLAACDEGRLAQTPQSCPIGDTIAEAATLAGAGETLTTTIEPGLAVLGNRNELVRLFQNLIANALTHAPGAAVRIAAQHTASHAAICVEDSGPGIAPEHLPHIGERFYRADPSRSRTTGGSGLGLAIAMEIAKAHRGSLAIQSTPGQGTSVTVTLPLFVKGMLST